MSGTTSGISFESWRKRLGLVLTPLVFVATYLLCDGLQPEGRKLAAILSAVSVMWITEILPLPVSALFGAILCIVLGVADARTVLAYFADPIVFVFIGGFMIARAMMVHGLDRRIALGFLSVQWIGSSPWRIIAGLGLVTAFISMWVSNTAVTAMMLPIGLGILSALYNIRVESGKAEGSFAGKNWPYATAMMLMIAYGASIGGIGTPVGTPPNLIGIGIIRTTLGINISFFRWMALTVPLFAVMAGILFLMLYLLFGRLSESDYSESGKYMSDYIRREQNSMGPWSAGQVNTLIGFGFAVVFWIVPGVLQIPWFGVPALSAWMTTHLPEPVVAISAVIILFILPVNLRQRTFTLSWPEAVKIDWGTILLFGGGLALGSLMFKTGVAGALGNGFAHLFGVDTLWMLTGVSIAMAIILSEAASNTASANMIIPVVIAIAQAANVSPLPPALGACLGASFGFMLPVSTPPNAIVYGSGMVPLPQMMKAGILFDIAGFFIIWAGLYLLCPVLGLM
jgi:sodium-dependent dicarboxylate transporter 2/3/5